MILVAFYVYIILIWWMSAVFFSFLNSISYNLSIQMMIFCLVSYVLWLCLLCYARFLLSLVTEVVMCVLYSEF